MPRDRRPIGLGVLLLASQLMNVGFDHIPPVTLLTILGQAAVYLGLVNLPWGLGEICVSSHYVWRHKQWKRLVLATFDHADDMHLYYNMVSFLWKGLSLERRLGSRRFFVVLAVFSVLVNVVYIVLSEAASEVMDDYSYVKQCAVGFSGVIFALKVLTTHYTPSVRTNVGGIWMPVKWAVWSELFLIQLMTPNASFLGHLAGIIVGLLYVKGPLKRVVKAVSRVFDGGSHSDRSHTRYSGPPSGTSWSSQDSYYRNNYGQPYDSYR